MQYYQFMIFGSTTLNNISNVYLMCLVDLCSACHCNKLPKIKLYSLQLSVIHIHFNCLHLPYIIIYINAIF